MACVEERGDFLLMEACPFLKSLTDGKIVIRFLHGLFLSMKKGFLAMEAIIRFDGQGRILPCPSLMGRAGPIKS
jgi:hypothetical protein